MFGAIFRFIKKVGRMFTAIGKIAIGLAEIVAGIGRELGEAPVGIYLTWVQVVIFVQTLWVFAITNFMCAMRMMNNASYCVLFYILDIFGQMLYMIPRLIIFALSFLGMPAANWEKAIWDFLENIDIWCIDNIGIHIIHLPKSIRQTCFSCRRLKPTAFVSKAKTTAAAIKNPILPLLTGGIGTMFGGMTRIRDALDF